MVLVWPRLWFEFILTLVVTAGVMGAATWLIAHEAKVTVQRGVALIAAAGASYLLAPVLPGSFRWLFVPLLPVIMFGLPVGLMLVGEVLFAKRRWCAPLVASFCFACAWGVWMARDYFYRLEY
jgi:hypothetical protein